MIDQEDIDLLLDRLREFPARLKATEEAELSFRIGGQLKTLNVLQGQPVKRGQLIASLDDADQRLRLRGRPERRDERHEDAVRRLVEGEFREVEPPARLVQTFQNHLQTLEFEDLGEQTKLTQTMRFDSTEQRDTTMQYGVEEGAKAGFERIDAVLRKIAA